MGTNQKRLSDAFPSVSSEESGRETSQTGDSSDAGRIGEDEEEDERMPAEEEKEHLQAFLWGAENEEEEEERADSRKSRESGLRNSKSFLFCDSRRPSAGLNREGRPTAAAEDSERESEQGGEEEDEFDGAVGSHAARLSSGSSSSGQNRSRAFAAGDAEDAPLDEEPPYCLRVVARDAAARRRKEQLLLVALSTLTHSENIWVGEEAGDSSREKTAAAAEGHLRGERLSALFSSPGAASSSSSSTSSSKTRQHVQGDDEEQRQRVQREGATEAAADFSPSCSRNATTAAAFPGTAAAAGGGCSGTAAATTSSQKKGRATEDTRGKTAAWCVEEEVAAAQRGEGREGDLGMGGGGAPAVGGEAGGSLTSAAALATALAAGRGGGGEESAGHIPAGGKTGGGVEKRDSSNAAASLSLPHTKQPQNRKLAGLLRAVFGSRKPVGRFGARYQSRPGGPVAPAAAAPAAAAAGVPPAAAISSALRGGAAAASFAATAPVAARSCSASQQAQQECGRHSSGSNRVVAGDETSAFAAPSSSRGRGDSGGSISSSRTEEERGCSNAANFDRHRSNTSKIPGHQNIGSNGSASSARNSSEEAADNACCFADAGAARVSDYSSPTSSSAVSPASSLPSTRRAFSGTAAGVTSPEGRGAARTAAGEEGREARRTAAAAAPLSPGERRGEPAEEEAATREGEGGKGREAGTTVTAGSGFEGSSCSSQKRCTLAVVITEDAVRHLKDANLLLKREGCGSSSFRKPQPGELFEYEDGHLLYQHPRFCLFAIFNYRLMHTKLPPLWLSLATRYDAVEASENPQQIQQQQELLVQLLRCLSFLCSPPPAEWIQYWRKFAKQLDKKHAVEVDVSRKKQQLQALLAVHIEQQQQQEKKKGRRGRGAVVELPENLQRLQQQIKEEEMLLRDSYVQEERRKRSHIFIKYYKGMQEVKKALCCPRLWQLFTKLYIDKQDIIERGGRTAEQHRRYEALVKQRDDLYEEERQLKDRLQQLQQEEEQAAAEEEEEEDDKEGEGDASPQSDQQQQQNGGKRGGRRRLRRLAGWREGLQKQQREARELLEDTREAIFEVVEALHAMNRTTREEIDKANAVLQSIREIACALLLMPPSVSAAAAAARGSQLAAVLSILHASPRSAAPTIPAAKHSISTLGGSPASGEDASFFASAAAAATTPSNRDSSSSSGAVTGGLLQLLAREFQVDLFAQMQQTLQLVQLASRPSADAAEESGIGDDIIRGGLGTWSITHVHAPLMEKIWLALRLIHGFFAALPPVHLAQYAAEINSGVTCGLLGSKQPQQQANNLQHFPATGSSASFFSCGVGTEATRRHPTAAAAAGSEGEGAAAWRRGRESSSSSGVTTIVRQMQQQLQWLARLDPRRARQVLLQQQVVEAQQKKKKPARVKVLRPPQQRYIDYERLFAFRQLPLHPFDEPEGDETAAMPRPSGGDPVAKADPAAAAAGSAVAATGSAAAGAAVLHERKCDRGGQFLLLRTAVSASEVLELQKLISELVGIDEHFTAPVDEATGENEMYCGKFFSLAFLLEAAVKELLREVDMDYHSPHDPELVLDTVAWIFAFETTYFKCANRLRRRMQQQQLRLQEKEQDRRCFSGPGGGSSARRNDGDAAGVAATPATTLPALLDRVDMIFCLQGFETPLLQNFLIHLLDKAVRVQGLSLRSRPLLLTCLRCLRQLLRLLQLHAGSSNPDVVEAVRSQLCAWLRRGIVADLLQVMRAFQRSTFDEDIFLFCVDILLLLVEQLRQLGGSVEVAGMCSSGGLGAPRRRKESALLLAAAADEDNPRQYHQTAAADSKETSLHQQHPAAAAMPGTRVINVDDIIAEFARGEIVAHCVEWLSHFETNGLAINSALISFFELLLSYENCRPENVCIFFDLSYFLVFQQILNHRGVRTDPRLVWLAAFAENIVEAFFVLWAGGRRCLSAIGSTSGSRSSRSTTGRSSSKAGRAGGLLGEQQGTQDKEKDKATKEEDDEEDEATKLLQQQQELLQPKNENAFLPVELFFSKKKSVGGGRGRSTPVFELLCPSSRSALQSLWANYERGTDALLLQQLQQQQQEGRTCCPIEAAAACREALLADARAAGAAPGTRGEGGGAAAKFDAHEDEELLILYEHYRDVVDCHEYIAGILGKTAKAVRKRLQQLQMQNPERFPTDFGAASQTQDAAGEWDGVSSGEEEDREREKQRRKQQQKKKKHGADGRRGNSAGSASERGATEEEEAAAGEGGDDSGTANFFAENEGEQTEEEEEEREQQQMNETAAQPSPTQLKRDNNARSSSSSSGQATARLTTRGRLLLLQALLRVWEWDAGGSGAAVSAGDAFLMDVRKMLQALSSSFADALQLRKLMQSSAAAAAAADAGERDVPVEEPADCASPSFLESDAFARLMHALGAEKAAEPKDLWLLKRNVHLDELEENLQNLKVFAALTLQELRQEEEALARCDRRGAQPGARRGPPRPRQFVFNSAAVAESVWGLRMHLRQWEREAAAAAAGAPGGGGEGEETTGRRQEEAAAAGQGGGQDGEEEEEEDGGRNEAEGAAAGGPGRAEGEEREEEAAREKEGGVSGREGERMQNFCDEQQGDGIAGLSSTSTSSSKSGAAGGGGEKEKEAAMQSLFAEEDGETEFSLFADGDEAEEGTAGAAAGEEDKQRNLLFSAEREGSTAATTTEREGRSTDADDEGTAAEKRGEKEQGKKQQQQQQQRTAETVSSPPAASRVAEDLLKAFRSALAELQQQQQTAAAGGKAAAGPGGVGSGGAGKEGLSTGSEERRRKSRAEEEAALSRGIVLGIENFCWFPKGLGKQRQLRQLLRAMGCFRHRESSEPHAGGSDSGASYFWRVAADMSVETLGERIVVLQNFLFQDSSSLEALVQGRTRVAAVGGGRSRGERHRVFAAEAAAGRERRQRAEGAEERRGSGGEGSSSSGECTWDGRRSSSRGFAGRTAAWGRVADSRTTHHRRRRREKHRQDPRYRARRKNSEGKEDAAAAGAADDPEGERRERVLAASQRVPQQPERPSTKQRVILVEKLLLWREFIEAAEVNRELLQGDLPLQRLLHCLRRWNARRREAAAFHNMRKEGEGQEEEERTGGAEQHSSSSSRSSGEEGGHGRRRAPLMRKKKRQEKRRRIYPHLLLVASGGTEEEASGLEPPQKSAATPRLGREEEEDCCWPSAAAAASAPYVLQRTLPCVEAGLWVCAALGGRPVEGTSNREWLWSAAEEKLPVSWLQKQLTILELVLTRPLFHTAAGVRGELLLMRAALEAEEEEQQRQQARAARQKAVPEPQEVEEEEEREEEQRLGRRNKHKKKKMKLERRRRRKEEEDDDDDEEEEEEERGVKETGRRRESSSRGREQQQQQRESAGGEGTAEDSDGRGEDTTDEGNVWGVQQTNKKRSSTRERGEGSDSRESDVAEDVEEGGEEKDKEAKDTDEERRRKKSSVEEQAASPSEEAKEEQMDESSEVEEVAASNALVTQQQQLRKVASERKGKADAGTKRSTDACSTAKPQLRPPLLPGAAAESRKRQEKNDEEEKEDEESSDSDFSLSSGEEFDDWGADNDAEEARETAAATAAGLAPRGVGAQAVPNGDARPLVAHDNSAMYGHRYTSPHGEEVTDSIINELENCLASRSRKPTLQDDDVRFVKRRKHTDTYTSSRELPAIVAAAAADPLALTHAAAAISFPSNGGVRASAADGTDGAAAAVAAGRIPPAATVAVIGSPPAVAARTALAAVASFSDGRVTAAGAANVAATPTAAAAAADSAASCSGATVAARKRRETTGAATTALDCLALLDTEFEECSDALLSAAAPASGDTVAASEVDRVRQLMQSVADVFVASEGPHAEE